MIVKKNHIHYIYQVREEVQESNNWENPRLDRTFTFHSDVEISLRDIEPFYNPRFGAPVSYWNIHFEAYDYNDIENTRVPNIFYLTRDTTIYYGIRFGYTVDPMFR